MSTPAVTAVAQGELRVQLFGPVVAWRGPDQIALGPMRQRALFTVLALAGQRPMAREELIGALWGDQPPPRVANAIQTYVKHLRHLLDPDRAHRQASTVLPTAGDGYALHVAPDRVDVRQFRELVAAARAARRDLDHPRVVRLTGRALALSGPAVAADLPLLADHPSISAIMDERRTAATWLAEAALRSDTPDDALGAIEEAANARPLDEPVHGWLMQVYQATGRRADALAVYERLRRRLADELGVDPTPQLRTVHRSMLRDDPAPVSPASAGPAAPAGAAAGARSLPRDLADFTGRTDVLRHLLEAVPAPGAPPATAPVVLAVNGMAGVGKTTLVTHLAHRIADRYPDGQLHIDLLGHSTRAPLDTGDALDLLLRQLGVPGEQIPDRLDERVSRWRRELAARRTLLLLDNVADTDQIAAILPTEPGCLTLVTSRRRLTGLDGAVTVALDVLSTAEAVALQQRIAGARVTAEPQLADEVARRCGYLPLAIRLACARLAHRPGWTLSDLAERLGRAQMPLRELAMLGRTVEAAFALSYLQLDASSQTLFRRLGLHPGPDLGLPIAAALADLDLPEAEQLLAELVDVHLVEEPSPNRYRLHDLLHDYASHLATADPAGDRHAAVGRLLDVYLHTAVAATRLLNDYVDLPDEYALGPTPRQARLPGDPTAALAWSTAERSNLVAATQLAADQQRHGHTWRLAHAISRDLCNHGYNEASLRCHELATEAAERAAEPRGIALSHNDIAYMHYRSGRPDEALHHLDQAIALHARLGDWARHAISLANKGSVLQVPGQRHHARDAYHAAAEVLSAHPELGQGIHFIVHSNLARLHVELGEYADAEREFGLHLALADRYDSDLYRILGLGGLGQLRLCQGRFAEAVALASDALGREAAATIDPRRRAEYTMWLGSAHRGLGQLEDALRHHQAAVTLYHDHGAVRDECGARIELAATLHALADQAGALREYRHALELATQLNVPDFAERATEGIAALGRAASTWDAARSVT
jgi:DNA-binding SARP family transcriptional activator/tetratricopeptide (TPR) repeat protein